MNYPQRGDMRIVKRMRGGCVTGFYVQTCTMGAQPEFLLPAYWRNVGRKCYTLEQAQEQMNLLRNIRESASQYDEEIVVSDGKVTLSPDCKPVAY